MALVDLTKQLAQQAILSATKDSAPAPQVPDSAGGTILSQLAAMQRVLKEDEELIVTVQSGDESIRIAEIFLASPQVAVLSGTASKRGFVRVIASVQALQLLCHTVKVAPDAKPLRVGLFMPKPKDSNA